MPSPASLRIGISTAAHPELKGPIQPMISSSWAADCAFSAHLAASHCPACAVASSRTSYSILMSPALLSRSCRAILMALTMVVVWARFAPCIGRSLTILAVGASPPPPPPPAPPPQPTTSNAAASPSTARIPFRCALFTLPPCLDPLIRRATHPAQIRYGPETADGSPLSTLRKRFTGADYGQTRTRCQAR